MSWSVEFKSLQKIKDSKYSIIKIQNKKESQYLINEMKNDMFFELIKESKLFIYFKICGNCTDCETYYEYIKYKKEHLKRLSEILKIRRKHNV